MVKLSQYLIAVVMGMSNVEKSNIHMYKLSLLIAGTAEMEDFLLVSNTHMSEVVAFRLGTYVEAGTVIGYVGETGNAFGPHLHLEMRRYPYTHMADNVDPKQFFGFN